jgi:hypothetical protein
MEARCNFQPNAIALINTSLAVGKPFADNRHRCKPEDIVACPGFVCYMLR